MLKLCWFEFRNKISASINWERRRVYEKWEKVIVTSENKLMLMRLGATLISERYVDFDDIFTAFENNETPIVSEEEVEEVQEVETETSETQEEVEVIQLTKTQIIEELTRLWVEFNKNDLKENLAKLLEDTLNAVNETETQQG